MKVMLVEDDPVLQVKLSSYIENMGYSITLAHDGETAVQLMELTGADLIICDVEMPGLDGFETVSIIRDYLDDLWVPIIFLTKNSDPEDLLTGFEVGSDDFIVKPVNERILHARMQVMERFIIMQQQLNEALILNEELLKVDRVTQVYSTNYFFDLARLQWSILERQKLPASLMNISIDNFDSYKDFYGEEASRDALKIVADVINSTIQRPCDFVGKMNDEHFVLMLPDTGSKGAEKVAEAICNAVESLNIEHKHSRTLGVMSVSIGISSAANLSLKPLNKVVDAAACALAIAQDNKDHCFEVIKSSSMKTSGVELH